MAKCRYIFFDVGNTLLFPNRERMLAPLAAERHPSLEQWQALERRTKHEFDQGMKSGRVDHGFWWTFHTYLLEECGGSDDGVRDKLIENTQHSANWDQILPGTRDALERLRQDYALAVISNSDGKIDAVLRRCGIADCFESITDSGNVGQEKPHPAIFASRAEGDEGRCGRQPLRRRCLFHRLRRREQRRHAGHPVRCGRSVSRAEVPAGGVAGGVAKLAADLVAASSLQEGYSTADDHRVPALPILRWW